MNLFDSLWDIVLSLFSKKQLDKRVQSNSKAHKEEYEAVERVNFTAIFANSTAP